MNIFLNDLAKETCEDLFLANGSERQCHLVSFQSPLLRYLYPNFAWAAFMGVCVYGLFSLSTSLIRHFHMLSSSLDDLLQVDFVILLALYATIGLFVSFVDVWRSEVSEVAAGLALERRRLPRGQWTQLEAQYDRAIRRYTRAAIPVRWIFGVLTSITCSCVAASEAAAHFFYASVAAQSSSLNPLALVALLLVYAPFFVVIELPLIWLTIVQDRLGDAA